jgi:anaerobic magnesium-protoporphyrin IX monomethyl ester cyclase
MGKKILLVRVPECEDNSSVSDPRFVSSVPLEVPLGVSMLAAVLRQEGKHEVVICDMFAEHIVLIRSQLTEGRSRQLPFFSDTLTKVISDFQPDIIGFSALFIFQHDLVKTLSQIARHFAPSALICLGGYSTLAPRQLLEDLPDIDVAFISEAEISFPKLIQTYEDGGRFDGLEGIAFRDGKEIIVNKGPLLLSDLDSLPFSAFDMLPLHLYKAEAGMLHLPLLTSRSCPFSCNFCASKLYGGRTLRKRSTSNLLEELEGMHDRYGIGHLWIRDELFNGDKKHAKSFLHGMMDRGLELPWMDSNAFHVNSLDEEFLDLCKASKCVEAIFAVESGSPRVLSEVMNKRVDLDHALRMGAHCRSIDLPFTCYFVIGNPGETREEILQTVDFAETIGADNAVFSIATPFPGTNYYDKAVENGQLAPDIRSFLRMKYVEPTLEGQDFSKEWLKSIQYDANIRINYFNSPNIKKSPTGAAAYFERILERYPFHVVAALIAGYCQGLAGNLPEEARLFSEACKLLDNPQNQQVYGRYLDWQNPITDRYRQYMSSGSSPL